MIGEGLEYVYNSSDDAVIFVFLQQPAYVDCSCKPFTSYACRHAKPNSK